MRLMDVTRLIAKSEFIPLPAYMERALRLCPSAKTWHYTQEDADMAQRVRSGNAQSNTNSPSLSQEDSGSATDSPRLTPEELWLRGPPK